MPNSAWIEESPIAITVCDSQGIIVDMNNKAALTFKDDGGKSLIGTNLMDCHNAASRAKLTEMIATGTVNSYTIQKAGKKKLIHQMPWIKDGKTVGLVELSFELPMDLPHFNRDLPDPAKS